jgi:hypothetical protein
MQAARVLAVAALAVLVLAPMARADWVSGMPYKMHYPQLPATGSISFGTYLSPVADDWLCTESGPVSDVHFWIWSADGLPPQGDVHVSIHDNIPQGPGGYSIPGNLLWARDFGPGGYLARPWGDNPGVYEINITHIPEPFHQDAGTVYWLDLQTADEVYWYVSASLLFMDSAVYWWQGSWELVDTRPYDMSFVITPEPATMALMGLGAVGLLARRRRK